MGAAKARHVIEATVVERKSFVGMPLLDPVFRVMQAIAPLRTMLIVAAFAASLNLALSIPLAIRYGLVGVSLGTSLVGYATCVVQIRSLRFLGPDWVREVSRMFGAGICSAGAVIAILLLFAG